MKNEDNRVAPKSYAFALRIIKLYKFLVENKKEYVLSKQIPSYFQLRTYKALWFLMQKHKTCLLLYYPFRYTFSIKYQLSIINYSL